MKQVLVHRYKMEEHLGRALGSEEYVDHKNGDKLDNRIENLRVCSKIQNEHYYYGITEEDISTVVRRLGEGKSYRKCLAGTNIKSPATVMHIKERRGL